MTLLIYTLNKDDPVKFTNVNSLEKCFDFVSHIGWDPQLLFAKSPPAGFSYSLLLDYDEVDNLPDYKSAYRKWRLKNILYNIFHPGNLLTIAFILMAIGLGLGIACPPALVFTALGFGALAVATGVMHAIRWLKVEKLQFDLEKDYLDFFKRRFNTWIHEHAVQGTLITLEIAMFLLLLALLVDHFIVFAIAGTAVITTSFSFAGIIVATNQFFSIAGLSPLLCVVLTIAMLLLALPNFLDTIRRIGSGIYELDNKMNPPENVVPTVQEKTTITPKLKQESFIRWFSMTDNTSFTKFYNDPKEKKEVPADFQEAQKFDQQTFTLVALSSYQAESDAYVYMLQGAKFDGNFVTCRGKGQDRVATGVIQNFDQLNPQQFESVIKNSFVCMEKKFEKNTEEGSCGLVVIVDEFKNEIITAHVGDSVAFYVIRDANQKVVSCIMLNPWIHNFNFVSDEEVARVNADKVNDAVFARGHKITDQNNSNTQLTRSLGDGRFKPSGLSAVPDIARYQIDPTMIPGGGDAFVVGFSDAVTDHVKVEASFLERLFNFMSGNKTPAHQKAFEKHVTETLNQLPDKRISEIPKGLAHATANRVTKISVMKKRYADDFSCILHPVNCNSGKVTQHSVFDGHGDTAAVAEGAAAMIQATLQAQTNSVLGNQPVQEDEQNRKKTIRTEPPVLVPEPSPNKNNVVSVKIPEHKN